jgi:hypothetical protein
MSKTIDYKLGDPCPGCGGTLRKAPQPTDAERAKAANREDPIFLPPHYDTAPKEFVEEHGELWRCPDCGYPARFKPEAKPDDKPAAGAAHVA